ncbi:PEPxxWA-CTERM sorting domain-containing protein [Polymorphobacter megasporae]|uniref:PEPxxWA-CTERM sorting domain-containing protein n=1 Tax=Glacieibacterium megasporae TaxID=2835787 RepID=UPI001C1E6B9C|nr:PEPxxWA-CTERM sorting domain-containing protein [Polymorphobacter megasporae]UAJ11841.1 PEPxxWA-CTERM sorting domain-containing protein [Polymorphobacter megasporae]
MRKIIISAASFVALAVAAPSAAAIYTLTYSGTLSNVSFGGSTNPVSGFQNGQSFVATYTVDTGKGHRLTGPAYDWVYGGPNSGTTLAVTTVFTVAGVKQTAFGSAVDSAAYLTGGALDLNSYAINTSASSTLMTYGIYTNSTGLGASASLEDVPRTASASLSTGYYSYTVYDFDHAQYQSEGQGTLNIDSVTVAVPEPASWLMMIVGFGLVGVAVRRRMVVAA